MTELRLKNFQRGPAVRIRVNGRVVEAYQGETVQAALQAAGLVTLNRSPRLGEKRGALCGMGVCYGCLVTIDGRPNQRACHTLVREGLEVLLDVS